MNIKNIISKSLINYDISNEKYESLIRSKKQPQIDRNNNKIIFKDKEFDYEILGIFDDQTKVWLWSWLIPSIKQSCAYEEQLIKTSSACTSNSTFLFS